MRPSLRLIESGMKNEIPTAPAWRGPLSDYLAYLRDANAALREQLVATGAVEPSGGGDHVA